MIEGLHGNVPLWLINANPKPMNNRLLAITQWDRSWGRGARGGVIPPLPNFQVDWSEPLLSS